MDGSLVKAICDPVEHDAYPVSYPSMGQNWRQYCFPYYDTVDDVANGHAPHYLPFGSPDPEDHSKVGIEQWFEEGEILDLEETLEFGFDPTGKYRWVGARCKHVTGYNDDYDPEDPESGDPYYTATGYGDYFYVAVEEPIGIDALVEQAVDALVAPEPEVEFSPPPDSLVAQMETWLYVPTPWEELSESASAGFVTVTATATPQRTVWDMGDGTSFSCGGPGEAWKPGFPDSLAAPCGHTYTSSTSVTDDGLFHGLVGIEWELTWTVEVGGEETEMGPVDPDQPTITTESEFSVDVDEIQAIGKE